MNNKNKGSEKKMKKLIPILLILLLAISAAGLVSATGNVKDLKLAHGIDVNDEGKLIDTYHDNKELGNVTPVESVDAGEQIVHSCDANALEDTLSADPLVSEYIVETTPDDPNGGIFFMFGHGGDIYLAFVHTDNMGDGMLKRMTEFCQYQGVV